MLEALEGLQGCLGGYDSGVGVGCQKSPHLTPSPALVRVYSDLPKDTGGKPGRKVQAGTGGSSNVDCNSAGG
jgi:hypothetical protein